MRKRTGNATKENAFGAGEKVYKSRLFLSVFLAAILLVLSWYFMFYRSADETSDSAIRDTSKIYLKEIAEQKKNQIRLNLEGQTRQLAITAETLKKEDTGNLQSLRAYLSSMKTANEFDFMGVLDAEGMIHTDMKSFSGISKFRFISKELQGSVTEFNNSVEDKNLVMVVVPVEGNEYDYEGAELVALIAGIDAETIAERLSLFDSSTYTLCEVMDKQGGYVVQAPSDHIGSGSNFLSSMKRRAVFEEGFSYDTMVERIANGQPEFISYYVEDIKYFTYLIPIEGTEWYVISTIQYGAVSAGVNTVRATMTRNSIFQIVVVTIAFFSCFILYHEMRKRQEKSARAQIKAEESNRAKSDFLTQMSHDIRTPMNAIVSFTNFALKEDNPAVIKDDYLPKIKTSSNHLLMLINDVLEMSRIESGKIELTETACNLAAVLENLRAVIGLQIEESKLVLDVRQEATDVCVYCDKLRLQQIMLNLLSNSMKFTPKGGRIELALRQISGIEDDIGQYEIEVSDTGIGMSEEFVRKAFEPFERERTSTDSGLEGTGLGLPIVKKIVDAMGGEIRVKTAPEKGTTFTICLKLRVVEEAKAKEMLQRGEDASNDDVSAEEMKQFFGGKRVLLVEDNHINRVIAEHLLKSAGFLVEVAVNGELAVGKVAEAEPDYYDVVLMDVQMPVMNGCEATVAIRAMEGEKSKVKIIAVTANAFDSDKEEVFASGMDGYIAKPIDVKELFRVLKSAL